MNWTREQFQQDRERYQREINALHAQGFDDDHPLIKRQLRRIEVVDRVITDPRFGLTEEDA